MSAHRVKANSNGRKHLNITTYKRLRRVASGAVLAAVAALTPLDAPAVGHADPGPHPGPNIGCETVHGGVLGMDRRKICDGPQQPDGTWKRTRTIYTPAFNSPSYCVRSSYSDSGDGPSDNHIDDCGGHEYPESTSNQETPDHRGAGESRDRAS
jgi:hypothetical protein